MNEVNSTQPVQFEGSSVATKIEGDRTPRRRYRLYGASGQAVPLRLWEDQHMPQFKSDDAPHMRPQEVWDAHAQVFDFAKKEDIEAYNKIIDMVAKQRAIISRDEVNWDSASSSYKTFLRWVEIFVEKPQVGAENEQQN